MLKKLSLLTLLALYSLSYSTANAQTVDKATTDETPQSEYVKCMDGNDELSDEYAANCMSAEVKRYDKAINKQWEEFLKKPQFQKWNNGNGLFRGNIKDTNDSFAAYRSRFCSFYNLAMQNYSVSKEYGRQECMLRLSQFYYDYLVQIARDYDADME